MDKKKLKTKDGSEFTVFYLKTEPKNEPSENTYYLTPEEAEPIVQDNWASWEIKESGLWDIYGHLYKDEEFKNSLKTDSFGLPSFGLPFSEKEELMIDDKIESDKVNTPIKDYIYKYSEDMTLYRYISEKMVDGEPFWELVDNKSRTYLVKAEDCYLYSISDAELEEFLGK
jgi:hypothetical protein